MDERWTLTICQRNNFQFDIDGEHQNRNQRIPPEHKNCICRPNQCFSRKSRMGKKEMFTLTVITQFKVSPTRFPFDKNHDLLGSGQWPPSNLQIYAMGVGGLTIIIRLVHSSTWFWEPIFPDISMDNGTFGHWHRAYNMTYNSQNWFILDSRFTDEQRT